MRFVPFMMAGIQVDFSPAFVEFTRAVPPKTIEDNKGAFVKLRPISSKTCPKPT